MKFNPVQKGWAFYDWANSVYSLVISTAVFPIYFSAVAPAEVEIFGRTLESSALYSYSLTFSFLVVVLISPLLSGLADRAGNRLIFLKIFCYLGAGACAGLFFFSEGHLALGLSLSILASIGFWGSIVFYNAYLPEIATLDQQDRLSARGFTLGYLGSGALLISCLLIITFAENLGFHGSGAATRFCFLLTGLWWAGFAQITFRRLPKPREKAIPERAYLKAGWQKLSGVYQSFLRRPNLKTMILAFFFLSVGVQTVILLAGIFGSEELGLASERLILTILIIQFVGILGAELFSRLAESRGNVFALQVSVFIWALICVFAYLLQATDPLVEYKFYGIGALVGLVLGGIQSLSRSTYAKLIPPGEGNTSYFSFFDVTEKIAIVLGTFLFGFFVDLTGSMRVSALLLSFFFAVSFVILFRLRSKRLDHS